MWQLLLGILGLCRRIALAFSMRHSVPRAQHYGYISFLKEGMKETHELPLGRQNRRLPVCLYLFQENLAIEIYSPVGEILLNCQHIEGYLQ